MDLIGPPSLNLILGLLVRFGSIGPPIRNDMFQMIVSAQSAIPV